MNTIPKIGAAIVAAVAISVWGCGSEDLGRGDPKPLLLDEFESIDVVDLEWQVSDLPTAARVEYEHRLDLGGARDAVEEELSPQTPFHNAVFAPTGGFLVVDFVDLKQFDSDGRFLKTLGRSGQGPGEFGQISTACISNDGKIVAIDYAASRAVVFASDGEHISTFPFPPGAFPVGACLADGSLLVRSTPPLPTAGDPALFKALLSRLALDGESLDPLVEIPVPPPLGILSPSAGAGLVQVHGERIYVGTGLDPELRIYEADGTSVRVVRWREPRVAFSDEVLADLIESGRLVVPVRAQGEIQAVIRRLQQEPRPKWLPVYGGMRVDPAGRVWLEDHELAPGETGKWTVVGTSGEALGRVQLPQPTRARGGDVRLGTVGLDEVVLIWRDAEEGFVHLTVHPIEWLSH